MIVQITGFTSSLPPFDIFLCDPTNTSCFFVSGLTEIPPSIIIDTEDYFPNEIYLYLKIIDINGCIYTSPLDCDIVGKVFQDLFYFKFMDDEKYYYG